MSHTGETPLEIGGERLTVVFDWRALARARTELGVGGAERALGGADLDALAKLVSIGLARHHPDWTAERVLDTSPPVSPTVEAIAAAMNAAYWGPKGEPDERPENPPKPLPMTTRFRALWRRLTGRG